MFLFLPRYLGLPLSSSQHAVMNIHRLTFSAHRQPNVQSWHGFSSSELRSQQQSLRWKLLGAKKNKFLILGLKDDKKSNNKDVKNCRKKGSFGGAVALIIGTSIGSGILALPNKTSPAGLFPSSVSLTMCWAFLLIEALLLVEINVVLQRKKKIKAEENTLEVMSIRTMAQETLGEFGGALATMTYVFLGYTCVVAYCSKSGEIIHRLIGFFPEPVCEALFALLFTALISVGGTRATDQVNQWLTVTMIGLLIAIEAVSVVVGGWSGFEGSHCDWGKVPETFPVMIFALVYHDIVSAPCSILFDAIYFAVLCAYLDNDLSHIRASIIVGSVVPLIALLIWEAIGLGLSNRADQSSDPLGLLLNVRWGGVPFMVEAFSLLAVGTSLIGTLLGFWEFFKEQLNNMSPVFTRLPEKSKSPSSDISIWWEKNKVNATAMAMAVLPSLLVSTTVSDAFSSATEIAGGYCMTMLYGVLPPAMAWAMNEKQLGGKEELMAVSRARPALVGAGIFACAIVAEQIFQDFSFLLPASHNNL